MAFVPTSAPPSEPARSRWYLVRGGELLVGADGALAVGGGPEEEVADTEPVFLGLEDGAPVWARGVAAGTEAPDGGRWVPLLALGSELPAERWRVAGRAVQLVDWARTSRFCGRCGTRTEATDAERVARCPRCGLTAYPRLAPAVIVLVRRGSEVLLARNANFRGGMFSCVAGFVEAGETLEEAVHREVAEEVGVRLREVRYFASQPWPFPHSLMVGFTAEYGGGEVAVDGTEIAEASWFGAADLPRLPPPLSIARTMIDAWRRGDGLPEAAL